ncbi:FAD-dependent oxidoreductase [Clostridium sp. SM-530-WT-3G]|uniref:NAD(P)/FAD-dependent oxidoreductase n=1 Tax=Clostridium sp. SM-530-WT-3G TaxID=2725303 RepID=UPI00145C8B66|nr:FAD-dependent oxidoreductase [Clostridium sp. SM-530-WT-3G]NME82609.1 FAD-dependent oxidoreductase [Clostridium sp. SM-530-WT-3G]
MLDYDLIIIGAGIAGMTAALGAAESGLKKILLIEREEDIGGIVNQFIHNDFGKKFIGECVTGPEYIQFLKNKLKDTEVDIYINSTVLDITVNKTVVYVNPVDGVKEVTAGAIIFAMGCKERLSGNVDVATNGLTGIFTVGEAQRIVNIEGYLPGKNAIITAKDKWGFILARRLLIEGGNVDAILIEKKFEDIVDDEIADIIDGFDMPIVERTKVINIYGDVRINTVEVINLDTKETINHICDSLILSVGFIPENYKIKKLKIEIDENTKGPKVIDYMTSIDGFFACGNIIYGENTLKMKDIDGYECGKKAAEYINRYLIS